MTNLAETILHFDHPSRIETDLVWRRLERDTVVALRGLVDPTAVRKALETIKTNFSTERDNKRKPGDYDAIKANYQRLCIGMTGGLLSTNPRFFRIFYNPLWDEDIYGMHSIFKRMVTVRNRLLGAADEFAMGKPERGLWSACRIQHYPRGGGFLIPHKDVNANNAVGDAGFKRSANIILIMTRRGLDFHQGGGFIEIDGERVFYEDQYEIGDLILYDEQNVHGVEDVDPLEPTDIASPEGRYAAFATLFRD